MGPSIFPCLHADSWGLASFELQLFWTHLRSISGESDPQPMWIVVDALCTLPLCCHCCSVSVTEARLASTSCRGSAGVFHRGRTALCWSTMQISSDCKVRYAASGDTLCCKLWCGVGIIETAEGGKKPKNLDGRRRRNGARRGTPRASVIGHLASTGMIDIATETYPNAERHPTSYRYAHARGIISIPFSFSIRNAALTTDASSSSSVLPTIRYTSCITPT